MNTPLFCPKYQITPRMAKQLMLIERLCQKATCIPSDLKKLLRKKTKANLVTYFRIIEDVPGALELKGYLVALKQLHTFKGVTVASIKQLHAYLLGHGARTVLPSQFRRGQNAVLDGETQKILYLPPKAHDVPQLMKQLVEWIQSASDVPCPIVAGIAHFGINSIHPYYDGNGRTARLVTRQILHEGGYDINGLYCLEKYYTEDLEAYYNALAGTSGKSSYNSRARGDITSWLDYFLTGMAASYGEVLVCLAKSARRDSLT